ncbi:MAG: hypothetical protein C0610_16735 [Desulfobacteraceae bacterium]|nr:MAG: hypothetical protein C0610_16735 [Desulfobacteraceae bacterium]
MAYLRLLVPYLKKIPIVGTAVPTIWFLGVALNETLKESAARDEFAWRDGLLAAADQLVLMLQWLVG